MTYPPRVPRLPTPKPYVPRSHVMQLSAVLNYRGSTMKIVHVRGAHAETTDDAILDAALKCAGETRSSLFGWHIDRTLDVVAVSLHTD